MKPEKRIMSEPLSKGAELIFPVEDLSNFGYGVGHAPDGRVIFAAGALPGDRVRAILIKITGSYFVARVTEILSASPFREADACGAPLSCGGCVYRGLTYKKELELKENYVRQCFRQAGLPDVKVLPVRSTGQTVGYRNKALYPIAAEESGALFGGFFARKSHRVIPADGCVLQPPSFGEILRDVCSFLTESGATAYDEKTGRGLVRHLYLRAGKGSGEVMACLVINGRELPREADFVRFLRERHPEISTVVLNRNEKNTNLVLGTEYRTLYGSGVLHDRLCGLSFDIAPAAFYQVNHDAAELLYGIAGDCAGLTGRELLLDLYCGAGTIGLSLSHRVRAVVGIEIEPAAVRNARANAEKNGVRNTAFYCGDAGDAERLLEEAEAARGTLSPDVVILDPPRRGCDARLLDFLARRRVPKIVYVSCGPDTLARDAAFLCARGYLPGDLVPVDLFPRTGHVESVLSFVRSKNA